MLIEFRNGREEGEEDDVVTVVSDKQSKLRDCWGARELVSSLKDNAGQRQLGDPVLIGLCRAYVSTRHC